MNCEIYAKNFPTGFAGGGAIVGSAMALKDKKAITSKVHRKMSIAQREEHYDLRNWYTRRRRFLQQS